MDSPVQRAVYSSTKSVMPRRSLRHRVPLSEHSDIESVSFEVSKDFGDSGKVNSKSPVRHASEPQSTPQMNLVSSMKQRLEQQLILGSDSTPCSRGQMKTSPGLARLMMTPGSNLRDKQAVLSRKHHEAKSRSEKLNIGGGVSIWPQMDNMRLTASETVWLVAGACGLSLVTLILFRYIHGEVMLNLMEHNHRLSKFSRLHKLETSGGNVSFSSSVLTWHTSFQSAMEDIHISFNMSLSDSPASYQLCVLLYVGGIAILLYYLADNMLAKNKLTPRRIKTWVCLLVVVAVWTLMCLQLLVLARNLEAQVQINVHLLAQQMGELVYQQLDLTMYRDVLQYWHIRCLPPTTRGTLNVLGLVAVQDISYYLQYYSLPVLTALLTPVLRLIVALAEVYGMNTPV